MIALVSALVLIAWLVSGQFTPEPSATPTSVLSEQRDPLASVRIRVLESRAISREIVISGRTEPARAVTLRAEVDGRIIALGAERGARVETGEVIAQIAPRDLRAQLREAQASVKQRQLEFQAAKKLIQQGLQSEVKLAEAQANLDAASARVERISIEIANTRVRAPFAGVLERRPVEVGAYVRAGDEVARVLELNPILVTGNVTQQEVHYLAPGDSGNVRLITGQVAEGRVRFIASEADKATRTFRVELEVSNPDGALVSGITTEIRIPVTKLSAHYVSPAFLSLNSMDELGVKTVNDKGIVEFHPVEVVRATADGLWVAGLAKRVRIVTVGQGFVNPGEHVRVVLDEEVAGSMPQRQSR